MGDRSAEMLNIMIAIISVVALMALGFAIFTISKRMANSAQNDLVNQLSQVTQSLYTDLDQQQITGARVRQAVRQAKTTDCAILISTLNLSGATAPIGSGGSGATSTVDGQLSGRTDTIIAGSASSEASLNGQLLIDAQKGKVPFVIAENYNIVTSVGTMIYQPVFVNYGSILKNGVKGDASVDSIESIITYSGKTFTLSTVNGWGNTTEYAQTILYKDGKFITKLEYVTNSQTSRILRYDNTPDFDKSGKTMTITDTNIFNSYILTNAGGDYLGLVFVQVRK